MKISLPPLFSGINAVAVKDSVKQAFQADSELKRIILDFSDTTFMDSSGIGALVTCHKLVREHNSHLILHHVSAEVMMVLSLTELDKIFEIEPKNVENEENEAKNNNHQKKSELSPIITHPSMRSRPKRYLDILGAVVGLTITGLIFIPIAIAIKLEDGGPIFFGQTRCSWLGQKFKMWKFRSMVIHAESIKHLVPNKAEGALFKNPDDPRITKIGRFLRRTSLDEFPQFWNVLKGEMSLVGTRPPTPDEIDRYEILQWKRLDIKPGITGEWQVYGRSKINKFEDVVKLDLRYQENWNFWYDLQLIYKTVAIIFHKDSGAY